MKTPIEFPPKKLSINFVTGNGGSGHIATYKAIRSIIEQQQLPWQVSETNIDEMVVQLAEQKQTFDIYKLFGTSADKFINQIAQSGWTWIHYFMTPLNKLLIALHYDVGLKMLESHWREQKPDLVISVIPLFNKILWDSLQRARPGTPVVTVLTDFADMPSAFWIEPKTGNYIVCGTERAAKQARSLGVQEQRIVETSGIVLHPRFYEPITCDRAQERQHLGLDPDLLTGLVLFGGCGSDIMLEIAQHLECFHPQLQLIFLCGHNEEVASALRARPSLQKRFVSGFTQDIPYYMHLADFFIGKPGPGSLSEALVMNLPVIVERNWGTIPQERYNAEWVRQKQVGLVIPSFRQIQKAVEQFLDPENFAHYRANVSAIKNRAVFEIPEILQQVLASSKKTSVSIVVYAHNAAITISGTLESILAQTYSNWEVIVVNDGSDAKTTRIVNHFATKDSRIRLVNQSDRGACIARNTGIEAANFDWLLFIDADDWILPTHLECLIAILATDSQLDVAYCGWARVTSDRQPYGPPECSTVSGDLFDLLAEGNPFALHGCVVRRSLVERVGKFDPSLKTHADWDLWQRIARTGAYFGGTEEVLALDRIGFSSKSAMFLRQQWFRAVGALDATPLGQRVRRSIYKIAIPLAFQAFRAIYSTQQHQRPIILGLFMDAMQVLAQGHQADPRVLTPDPNHAQGKSTEHLPALELGLACAYAGLAIGAGEDFYPILAQLRDEYGVEAISTDLMKPFLYALPVPTCHPLSAYHFLWESLEQPINELAIALEQRLKIPAFARRACLNMERGILEHAAVSRPVTLGTFYAVQIELTQPIADISAPSAAERLHCTIELAGKRLGFLELPIFNRIVTSQVLADTIAVEFAETIFQQASEPQLQILKQSLNLEKTNLKLAKSAIAEGSETFQLPILMYHHVAPTGSAKFTRWRVTPEAFEEQLRCLRDAGAYSITLAEWRTAIMTKTPLPGKPILITFDDGYLDFATYAWPLLKRYGFSATVFIVTDFVGKTNRWDRIFDYGEDLAILNWEQIKQLHAEGVEFGSHTLNHYPLTSLSPAEIVREASRSRAMMERELGIPITTFAYPYGDLDPVVQHLIGRCGYDIAVSCRSGYSSFQDPLLQLARIEIQGTDSLEEFENKLFLFHQEVAMNSVASVR